MELNKKMETIMAAPVYDCLLLDSARESFLKGTAPAEDVLSQIRRYVDSAPEYRIPSVELLGSFRQEYLDSEEPEILERDMENCFLLSTILLAMLQDRKLTRDEAREVRSMLSGNNYRRKNYIGPSPGLSDELQSKLRQIGRDWPAELDEAKRLLDILENSEEAHKVLDIRLHRNRRIALRKVIMDVLIENPEMFEHINNGNMINRIIYRFERKRREENKY